MENGRESSTLIEMNAKPPPSWSPEKWVRYRTDLGKRDYSLRLSREEKIHDRWLRSGGKPDTLAELKKTYPELGTRYHEELDHLRLAQHLYGQYRPLESPEDRKVAERLRNIGLSPEDMAWVQELSALATNKRAPRHRGRPRGSSYTLTADANLCQAILDHEARTDRKSSRTEAVRRFVHLAYGASEEARMRRLVRRLRDDPCFRSHG